MKNLWKNLDDFFSGDNKKRNILLIVIVISIISIFKAFLIN